MRRIREEVGEALRKVQAGMVAGTLESSTLDFKEEGRSRDDFLRELAGDAICFANAGGGALVVGRR
jgi:ATP-dependent DNA helicase RecG